VSKPELKKERIKFLRVRIDCTASLIRGGLSPEDAGAPSRLALSVHRNQQGIYRKFLSIAFPHRLFCDVFLRVHDGIVFQFDLLAHLAYGRPLGSRAARADAFRRREGAWLAGQAEEARAVILALVDKYVLGGIREMTDPAVFRVSPFREMGEARGVLRRFGGDPLRFRATMAELQRRLYAEAA